MEDSAINILDHNSLGELNNAFEYAADSVLKVQNAIAGYLKGVIEVMENQLEIVKQKYEEAKEYLSSAQEELDDCLSSQEYDPETGEVYPSCSSERSNVRLAEAECNKWRERYDTADKIVSQCKAYKSDWEHKEPFTSGGDEHLEMLGKQYTDEATKKLRKIIELVNECLNVSFSSDGSTQPSNVEVLGLSDKRRIISNSDARVRKEQIHELNRHKVADANRVAKCEKCGRPLSVCICGNTRKNIQLA